MNRRPPNLDYSRPASPVGQRFNKNASIVVLGQCDGGRNVVSSLAGEALRREVVRCHKSSSPSLAVSTLSEHQWGKIIDLDYALARDEEVEQALLEYGQHHGPVVLVAREMDAVIDELRKAGEAEAIERTIESWDRSETYLRVLATCIFPFVEDSISGQDWYTKRILRHGDLSDDPVVSSSLPPFYNVKQDLLRLLRFIRGTYTNHVPINSNRSYYLSLTFPQVEQAQDVIEELSIGIDCWELRADLLADHSLASITHQLGLLRRFSDLPIIFSMRTRSQAGSLPDPSVDGSVIDLIYEAASTALKMGVEYVDVSSTLPVHFRAMLIRNKGNSKIIASYQDFEGRLSWRQDKAWFRSYYDQACEMGADVVMLVNLAKSVHDNVEARNFAGQLQKEIPLIVINVGNAGKTSRIWNHFLTPVSHRLLPTVSAPGQLTYLESQQLSYLMSIIKPKAFYIFGGADVERSLSLTIHTTAFRELGFPYEFVPFRCDQVEECEAMMRSPAFGGAAITRPHKVNITPFLRNLSPHARSIGAVNTIIASPTGMMGENTDWRAIHTCILRSRLRANLIGYDPSVLVIGAGGLARAAVYAMLQLGIRRVQIVNRSEDRAQDLVASLQRLDTGFELVHVRDPSARDRGLDPPDILISTIPQLETQQRILDLVPIDLIFAKSTGILLEMGYGPTGTSQLQIILGRMKGKSWDVISAMDTLSEQGFEQIRLWTGRRAPKMAIRQAVMNSIGHRDV